jgi:hypothetical protein
MDIFYCLGCAVPRADHWVHQCPFRLESFSPLRGAKAQHKRNQPNFRNCVVLESQDDGNVHITSLDYCSIALSEPFETDCRIFIQGCDSASLN